MILSPEVDGWGKYIIGEDSLNHVGFMAARIFFVRTGGGGRYNPKVFKKSGF